MMDFVNIDIVRIRYVSMKYTMNQAIAGQEICLVDVTDFMEPM